MGCVPNKQINRMHSAPTNGELFVYETADNSKMYVNIRHVK